MKSNGGVELPRSADGSLDLGKLEQLGKQEKIKENETLMDAATQANELAMTVKTSIKPSKVHGVGVFALRDIVKGEQVFCALTKKPVWYSISMGDLQKYLGSTRPEVLQLILDRWPQVINGSLFLSPNYDARLPSFMNHSDDHNYDPLTDKALKDIKAGEEVFENYRTIRNYEIVFPWLKKLSTSKKKKK